MKRTVVLLLTLTALSSAALALAGDTSSKSNACPASCTSCTDSCPLPSCGLCK